MRVAYASPSVRPSQLPVATMRRLAPFSLALSAMLVAQAPPEPERDASEPPFLLAAAKDLDAFATLAYGNGFPRRARDVWIELLAEYDTDDAVAREALGFVRVGTAWQPKPGFDYPPIDQPNLKNAKLLETRWQAVAKKLGDGHRELAVQLQAAGKQERSAHHFRRALRFLPTDAKAQQGLGARTVEGVTGTDLELELLRRSRRMDRAIARELAKTLPVRPVDQKDPRIDGAGVTVKGFATEHFVVLGDRDDKELQDLAQWAERSLGFCIDAFADSAPWATPPEITTTFAFFADRATWGQVVKHNAAEIGDVDFVLQHTSACGIRRGKGGIFLSGQSDLAVATDYVVRKVAEEYAAVRRDAVVEGVGHAVVGMFFGRNLIMTVAEQKKEGTVAGRDPKRFEMPDLEVWRELARELAFDLATAPAAHLPRISAAKFANEERIKAWSFADYLLRRDPALLLALDEAGRDAKNDLEVMAAFLSATKLQLPAVEADWRVFYTGDSAALRALRQKATPLDAISKDASAWIDEFNRVRKELNAEPVSWSPDASVACKQHADYLVANKVQRGAEQTQDAQKPGYSNSGRLFAQQALVWIGDKDPKKGMAAWLQFPGFRDALLDGTLQQVGAFADGPTVVVDATTGRRLDGRIDSRIYPFPADRDGKAGFAVPPSVPVALLGPEVQQLLDAAGKGKQKAIGYPISAHFFAGGSDQLECTVAIAGKPVPGKLVQSTQGSRRVAAPGLWVFWPFDPLPKGAWVDVKWKTPNWTEKVTFQVQGS